MVDNRAAFRNDYLVKNCLPTKMKKVSWSEYLSLSNPWTKRLIGLETFSKKRNLEQIELEYNQDKYGKLLDFDFDDIERYKVKELEFAGVSDSKKVFISLEEELFESNLGLGRSIGYTMMLDVVKKYSSDSLCELGCGYGYNLSYLRRSLGLDVRGGEYSQNAVTIGNKLGVDVNRFNYYEIDDYKIIKDQSTVLTVHSIEQLPSAQCFLDGIEANKHKVDVVINIEPSYLVERNSLIGILRNRYIELNDYNRDLFSLIKSRNDIEIIEYERDIFGLNPLNSASLVVWKFR